MNTMMIIGFILLFAVIVIARNFPGFFTKALGIFPKLRGKLGSMNGGNGSGFFKSPIFLPLFLWFVLLFTLYISSEENPLWNNWWGNQEFFWLSQLALAVIAITFSVSKNGWYKILSVLPLIAILTGPMTSAYKADQEKVEARNTEEATQRDDQQRLANLAKAEIRASKEEYCGKPQEFPVTKTDWTVITVKEGCRVVGDIAKMVLFKDRNGEERLIIPGTPDRGLTGTGNKLEFKLPADSPEDEVKLAFEFPPI